MNEEYSGTVESLILEASRPCTSLVRNLKMTSRSKVCANSSTYFPAGPSALLARHCASTIHSCKAVGSQRRRIPEFVLIAGFSHRPKQV